MGDISRQAGEVGSSILTLATAWSTASSLPRPLQYTPFAMGIFEFRSLQIRTVSFAGDGDFWRKQ